MVTKKQLYDYIDEMLIIVLEARLIGAEVHGTFDDSYRKWLSEAKYKLNKLKKE